MSITYYTIKGKTDGFGAQYQSIMSGIAFCKYNKYTYIHTPFTRMQHNVDIAKLNKFIGVNNDHLKCNNLLPSKNDKIIEQIFSKEVHWHKNPSIYYTNEVLQMIRNWYFSTEKPNIGNIDIAIHIRRGDVSKKRNNTRYTDNSVYIKIIKHLRIKYPSYTITIFSEGKYDDFKELGLEEKNFKLNIDICETFHSLACAKVLITSISSFSYCAALINANTVYYTSFWHKKIDHWLSIEALIGI